jgi:hypothetical protein
MVSDCPSCGYTNIRSSKPRSIAERVANIFGMCHFRCYRCGRRFLRQVILLPNLRYARCPKCLRQDLTDWSEKYYYPGGLSNFWIWMGAGEQRCEPCRHNFVSFFARRPEPRVAEPEFTMPELQPATSAPMFPAKLRVVARWKTPALFRKVVQLRKWKVRIVFESRTAGVNWPEPKGQSPR